MVIKVLGLSLYGPLAASTRYRLMQYIPGLAEHGIELEVEPLLGDGYVQALYAGQRYALSSTIADYIRRLSLLARQGHYDVAMIHVELFPFLPGWIESRLIRIPYIYDFDDAFFLKYRLDRFKRVSVLLKNKMDPVVERATAVTAGHGYLAAYARIHNAQTSRLPTVVDTRRYVPLAGKRSDVFTIGWIGSPSTSVYLTQLVEPLERLGREGAVRFLIVGGHCDAIPGVEVVVAPWKEATEVELINSFDVGVMPLFEDEWAKGKCAFKLIQYLACGVPVVASPVGANLDVVTADCGFLADDALAWTDALRRLRDDEGLRRQFGQAGRSKIEEQYSLASTVPVMADVIKAAYQDSLRGAEQRRLKRWFSTKPRA